MRKITKIIALVLILSLALPSLFSCDSELTRTLKAMDPDERAVKLYELASENMDALQSYTAKGKNEIKLSVGGVDLTQTSTIERYFSGIGTETFEYTSKTSTRSKVGGDWNEITETEGYTQETAYYSYADNEISESYKSKYTQEQYIDYFENPVISGFEIIDLIRTAATKSSAALENGLWEISASGMSEESIENLYDSLGLNIIYIDASATPIKDANISAIITEDLYVLSIKLDFVFDSSDDNETVGGVSGLSTKNLSTYTPVVSLTNEFSEYNSTTVTHPKLSRYNEEDDANAIVKANIALAGAFTKDIGKFVVNTTNKTTQGWDSFTTYINDSVTFELKNGIISYRALSSIDGYEYDISYANGTQEITISDSNGNSVDSYSDSTNEISQKLFIYETIDPGDFSIKNIFSFTVKTEGDEEILTFNMKDCGSRITDSLTAAGGTIKSTKAKIELVLKGGVLEEYRYSATCKLVIQDTDVTVTVNSIYEQKTP